MQKKTLNSPDDAQENVRRRSNAQEPDPVKTQLGQAVQLSGKKLYENIAPVNIQK
jgi:hypothetical protein